MRELFIGSRRSGKTMRLIKKCHKDKNSRIVCPTIGMCKCTFDMAKGIGCPIPMPLTFKQFVDGAWICEREKISRFYFDELQMSLQIIARNVPVEEVVVDATNTDVHIAIKKSEEEENKE